MILATLRLLLEPVVDGGLTVLFEDVCRCMVTDALVEALVCVVCTRSTLCKGTADSVSVCPISGKVLDPGVSVVYPSSEECDPGLLPLEEHNAIDCP
jgi:hypothetical protein